MAATRNTNQNIFPKWANKLPVFILIGLFLLIVFIVFVFTYWMTSKNFDVGYAPQQPIPYSHKLHVGELGMDCRYCHNTVDRAAMAAVPPTEVCMNCHSQIKTDSPHIVKLTESYVSGEPIEWVRVHSLPDYAYFNHSRHVNAGVSCVSCHGRVDNMTVVHQVEPLSMSWCLDCHRAPEKHVRPREFVTQLDWSAENQAELGMQLIKAHNINPREDCSTCHR